MVLYKGLQRFYKENKALKKVPDVVRLYPTIPYKVGLKTLKEVLDRKKEKKITTKDLVKMAESVLKNN